MFCVVQLKTTSFAVVLSWKNMRWCHPALNLRACIDVRYGVVTWQLWTRIIMIPASVSP